MAKTPKPAKEKPPKEKSAAELQIDILWNLAAVVNDIAQVVKELKNPSPAPVPSPAVDDQPPKADAGVA